ncbi:hypothetical protein CcaCcLH18_07084 [Colletotrichum camelliae]|nr:hypothetical protein CcaCcLH18_07084 [Colletotrichum camelliae]
MYTIGWIAALEKELTAALAILDETHQQPEDFEQNDKDSNAYSWGQIGEHNIVIASLGSGSYGLVSAATTATCMATSLPHLRFGLMVGIGAGVPSLVEHDIRLGDVVVSLPSDGHSGVIQYDLGKMGENGQFRRVGALSRPPEVLLKALTKLRAEHRLKDSNIPQILSKAIRDHPKLERSKGKDSAFVYQGAENDRLFEATSVHVSGKSSSQTLAGGAKRKKISDTRSCSHCDAEREREREERPTTDPEVHYGTIASGNLVIKDGMFRDQVLERLETDVLCYEMEAAGLMNNFPCLVIRGICDYADTHKNDRWQNYAALAAAAYAKELLGTIDARRVVLADKMQKIITEAQHAAGFWIHYARQADNEMSEGLIKELILDTDSQETYAKLRHHHHDFVSKSMYKSRSQRNFDVPPEGPNTSVYFHFISDGPETLLHHFVSYGVLFAVKIILELSVKDINTWSRAYDNALQDAAFQGYSNIVEELIRGGANVDAGWRYHSSALATAVEKSHEETVDILLRYNADTNIDEDILHRAISRGNIKIINMLLTQGATVSPRAFCLVCENSNTVLFSTLLKYIRSNSVASYCSYAFPRTCESGQYSMVQTLMRNKADIDTKDSNNLTGLYHAASIGHSNIVELLLKTGAQLSQGGDFEKSPLCAAVKNGHIDIMRLLLARDTHAKFFDETFKLALSCSTSCSRTAAVALLLETFKAKHQIDTKRAILTEALYAAISKSEEGYDRIVALLLDNGVDANAGIGSKESILSWTFGLSIRAKDKKAALNVVASLVDHGADPNEVHGIHGTFLETAVRIQEWGVAKILAERGAKKPPHYDLLQLMSSKRYQLQEEQHTTTTRHHVVTDYQTEMETADSV